jgi:hypothetical protein
VRDKFVENVFIAVRDGDGGHAFVARRLANWPASQHENNQNNKKTSGIQTYFFEKREEV